MEPRPISRRAVLAGGAGLVLLSACGGSSSGGDADAPTTADQDGRVLIAFFDGSGTLVSGSPQRLTFGIGDSTGALVKDGPATLDFTLTRDGGAPVGPVRVARHQSGLPRAYYPVTFTPQAAGVYEAATTLDGTKVTAAFQIGRADQVALPGTGDPMPAVATPTTTEAQGVDPICTKSPACPLHTVSLDDALAAGKRVALLVSTPAYCQTAICGPVLDVLLGQTAAFPDVTFIHAEVYRSAKDVEAKGAEAALAPVLEALDLAFEPALFLVGPDGRIAKRLDVIFDAVELRNELQALAR